MLPLLISNQSLEIKLLLLSYLSLPEIIGSEWPLPKTSVLKDDYYHDFKNNPEYTDFYLENKITPTEFINLAKSTNRSICARVILNASPIDDIHARNSLLLTLPNIKNRKLRILVNEDNCNQIIDYFSKSKELISVFLCKSVDNFNQCGSNLFIKKGNFKSISLIGPQLSKSDNFGFSISGIYISRINGEFISNMKYKEQCGKDCFIFPLMTCPIITDWLQHGSVNIIFNSNVKSLNEYKFLLEYCCDSRQLQKIQHEIIKKYFIVDSYDGALVYVESDVNYVISPNYYTAGHEILFIAPEGSVESIQLQIPFVDGTYFSPSVCGDDVWNLPIAKISGAYSIPTSSKNKPIATEQFRIKIIFKSGMAPKYVKFFSKCHKLLCYSGGNAVFENVGVCNILNNIL